MWESFARLGFHNFLNLLDLRFVVLEVVSFDCDIIVLYQVPRELFMVVGHLLYMRKIGGFPTSGMLRDVGWYLEGRQ